MENSSTPTPEPSSPVEMVPTLNSLEVSSSDATVAVPDVPTSAPSLLRVETTSAPSPEPFPSSSPTPAPSFIFHYMRHHGHRSEEPDLFIIFASTLAGMFGMLAILLVYRHCLKKREYTYTRVHHGLDPEEEQFKKTLESQNDEIDDLFNFSTDADESGADLEFDASELEQIEMLETYRSNLVAAADSPSSGQKI